MIEGGTGGNVIPASCTIVVGRRIVPGEDPQQVYDDLVALAPGRLPAADPDRVGARPSAPTVACGSPAFYQSADSPLVRNLAAWAGTPPTVAPFGTNALRYSGFAREMAIFGPGSSTTPTRRPSASRSTTW